MDMLATGFSCGVVLWGTLSGVLWGTLDCVLWGTLTGVLWRMFAGDIFLLQLINMVN